MYHTGMIQWVVYFYNRIYIICKPILTSRVGKVSFLIRSSLERTGGAVCCPDPFREAGF
jgi:hypothetical protein